MYLERGHQLLAASVCLASRPRPRNRSQISDRPCLRRRDRTTTHSRRLGHAVASLDCFCESFSSEPSPGVRGVAPPPLAEGTPPAFGSSNCVADFRSCLQGIMWVLGSYSLIEPEMNADCSLNLQARNGILSRLLQGRLRPLPHTFRPSLTTPFDRFPTRPRSLDSTGVSCSDQRHSRPFSSALRCSSALRVLAGSLVEDITPKLSALSVACVTQIFKLR